MASIDVADKQGEKHVDVSLPRPAAGRVHHQRAQSPARREVHHRQYQDLELQQEYHGTVSLV